MHEYKKKCICGSNYLNKKNIKGNSAFCWFLSTVSWLLSKQTQCHVYKHMFARLLVMTPSSYDNDYKSSTFVLIIFPPHLGI